MGLEQGFQVIYDTQITTTSTGGPWQPGEIVIHRTGTGRTQQAMARWVLIDNAGCSQGEALVTDFAATVDHGVVKASTTDGRSPHFRGIAGATIASNKFGFSIISGYCEKADLSFTAASGELLAISGSTAGKLSSKNASSFWGGTLGVVTTNGSAPFIFAVARGAAATGIGSVQILGMWA